MKRFEKVEIDDDLGILTVTDINAYQLRYLIGLDGNLTLGYPRIAQTRDGKATVTFFIPAGGDKPEVLKVICDHDRNLASLAKADARRAGRDGT